MSITVSGSIIIARKSGKRGDFNVGDLSTEIGEFEVKDAVIEEFDPGKYTGRFVISWIQPDSFTYRGRVFVKNRAKLEEIFVDDDGERGEPQQAPPPEPDPIDTQAPNIKPAPPVAAGNDAEPQTKGANASDPDQALFGAEIHELVAARATIKLDPTIDRALFRAQRDRLKAIGYRFDPKAQAWEQPGSGDIAF
jgi:hypothetical protein